jgi:hypothetical protein
MAGVKTPMAPGNAKLPGFKNGGKVKKGKKTIPGFGKMNGSGSSGGC